MVFSSPTFLFAFLPLTLLGLALMRHRGFQNTWLLGMSAVFYIWGAGAAVLVLTGVTAVSFSAGFLGWEALRSRPSRTAFRLALAACIAVLLIPLAVFKYLPTVAPAGALGGALAEIALPIGISFFTFHAISYVVDVAKGTIAPETSVRDYALYLFVFPHQIAGPIVRFAEIRDDLAGFRDASLRQVGYGITRFTWGLAKKALVADPVGSVADSLFPLGASGQLSGADAWAAAFLYAVQIYFDFSAYSDMAIGLALILGFHFPENFAQPYRSISVTEFWRRWHMTLTRWFRDYVYIPMGGNRHGHARATLALVTVFTLTALWHGAAITFLIWGAMHSVLLLIERVTGIRRSERFAAVRRVVVFLFLVVSWVPFRAHSGAELLGMWKAMFAPTTLAPGPVLLTGVTPFVVLAVVVGVVSLFGSRRTTGFTRVFGATSTRDLTRMRWRLAIPLTVVLFIASVMAILWSGFSPFLYYQF